MNVKECRVVLRPRGPLEVLDLTVRFSRDRWRALVPWTLALVLPLWAPLAVAAWWFEGHWALLAVPFLVGPALQAPFTLLAGRLLFADAHPPRALFGDLLARLGALFAATLVDGSALALSIASCGTLLPFVAGAVLYLPEATLLEKATVGAAVSRSVRLAGGASAGALTGAISRFTLPLWFGLVTEGLGNAFTSYLLQLGAPFGGILDGRLTPWFLLGVLLSQPAVALYRLFLYIDARTRNEGWDLQVGLWAAGGAR